MMKQEGGYIVGHDDRLGLPGSSSLLEKHILQQDFLCLNLLTFFFLELIARRFGIV